MTTAGPQAPGAPSGGAHAALRRLRNRAVSAAKGLAGVPSTAYVHPSASVARDLVAGDYAFVGPRCRLPIGVELGRYAMLAAEVGVVGDDHEFRTPGVPIQFAGRPPHRRTTIGADAWLGQGVTVMTGVAVGDGAVVAARSVVTRDVPPYEVWGGVPAARIGDRFADADQRAAHEAMLAGPLASPTFAGPHTAAGTSAGRERRAGPPHLCIVTTAHPLDDVRVNTKVARSFLAAGWRVTWLGTDHSYFAGPDYRLPGVEHRLVAPSTSRAQRLTVAGRLREAASGLDGVDWWYCPDPDAAPLALLLARRRGGRVVVDVHERFDAGMLDRWVPARAAGIAGAGVRAGMGALARACDLLIGVNDAVLEPYPGAAGHRLVVRNCAPRSFGADVAAARAAEFAEPEAAADRRSGAPATRPLVAFHGKALGGNGTPVLLDALTLVDDVRLLLFPGRGPADGPRWFDGFDAAVDARGVGDRLDLRDAVPHEDMPGVLAAADVGIVAYGRDLGVSSLPNRVFEYMACGLPVLVPDYAVEMRALVESEGIGRCADLEDPAAVAAELAWFRDHPRERAEMGRRARVAFEERHCWEAEFTRLLEAVGGPAT